MENWLVQRLAGSKKDTQRWVELAEALEEFWDKYFLPEVVRLENSRSLFTASDEDLEMRLEDMGDFFDVNLAVSEDSKPLAIAFRRDEIRYKNTEIPIQSILNRNFSGLDTHWLPLFAPVSGSYDEDNFFTEEDLINRGEDLNDFFMTSRGTLWVDEGHLRRLGYTRSEFARVIESEIEKVRPVHIVFDNVLFILTIIFDMLPCTIGNDLITTLTHRGRFQFSDLPFKIFRPVQPGGNPIGDFTMGHLWSLDQFIPYDYNPDGSVIKRPLQGIEGDWIPPVVSYRIKQKRPVLPLEYSLLREAVISSKSDRVFTFQNPMLGLSKRTQKLAGFNYFLGMPWSLDQLIHHTSGTGYVGGVEGDWIPPFAVHSIKSGAMPVTMDTALVAQAATVTKTSNKQFHTQSLDTKSGRTNYLNPLIDMPEYPAAAIPFLFAKADRRFYLPELEARQSLIQTRNNSIGQVAEKSVESSPVTRKKTGRSFTYSLGMQWSLDQVIPVAPDNYSFVRGVEGDTVQPFVVLAKTTRPAYVDVKWLSHGKTAMQFKSVTLSLSELDYQHIRYILKNQGFSFEALSSSAISVNFKQSDRAFLLSALPHKLQRKTTISSTSCGATELSLRTLTLNKSKSDQSFDFSLGGRWSLDQAITHSNGTAYVAGIEGDYMPPFSTYQQISHYFSLQAKAESGRSLKTLTPRAIYKEVKESRSVNQKVVSLRTLEVQNLTQPSDSRYVSFDDVPADFVELDKPFPVSP